MPISIFHSQFCCSMSVHVVNVGNPFHRTTCDLSIPSLLVIQCMCLQTRLYKVPNCSASSTWHHLNFHDFHYRNFSRIYIHQQTTPTSKAEPTYCQDTKMLEAIYVVRHGVSTLFSSCFFAKSFGSSRVASGPRDMSTSGRHYKQENVSTRRERSRNGLAAIIEHTCHTPTHINATTILTADTTPLTSHFSPQLQKPSHRSQN